MPETTVSIGREFCNRLIRKWYRRTICDPKDCWDQGIATMLMWILAGLYGTLTADVQQRTRPLKFDQYEGRAEAILGFYSLEDLYYWLNTKIDWFLNQSQYEPTNGDLIELCTSRRSKGMPFDVADAELQHPMG